MILWTSREWALFKKECPASVPMAVGIVVNKQVKGKILAKRMNVHIEHIKYMKRFDSFLKRVKGNDQGDKRRPKRKVPGFN